MTRTFPFKKILITQGELINLAGSEIIVLELAEFFSEQGCEVYILTNYYDNPIKKELRNIKNTQVFTDENALDQVNLEEIDLVWIHHQLIPRYFLERSTSAKTIFHHMSPYSPFEYPFSGNIETKLADIILYNSEETKKTITKSTKYQQTQASMVFNNPAPSYFYIQKRRYSDKPKRVLVISNHPPEEIKELIIELKNKNIEVIRSGHGSNDKYSRTMPNDLLNVDVVISIGKVVQYCLLTKTPIYVYDHFGGPGYLNQENYDKAMVKNFSGRGFSTKQAHDMAQEIANGYKDACYFVANFSKEQSVKFLLEKQFEYITNNLSTLNKKTKLPTISERKAYCAVKELIRNLIIELNDYRKLNHTIQERLDTVEDDNKILSTKNIKLTNKIIELYSSKSWRVTKPLRKISKIILKGRWIVY